MPTNLHIMLNVEKLKFLNAQPPPPPPPKRPNIKLLSIGIGTAIIVVISLFIIYFFLLPHSPAIVSASQVSQNLGENYQLQSSSTSTKISGNESSSFISLLGSLQPNLVLSSTFVSNSGARLEIIVLQYQNQSVTSNIINQIKYILILNSTLISVSGSVGYYVKFGNFVFIISQYKNYIVIINYTKGKGNLPTQQQFEDLLDAQLKLLP